MNERDLELLNAYLDDALGPAERAQVEARLAAEEALRAELDALRLTRALVRGLPTLRAPRSLAVTPALLRAKRPVAQVVRFQQVISFASAAAALVLVALGIGLLSSPLPQADPAVNQVAAAPTLQVTIARDADVTGEALDQTFAASPVEQAAQATDEVFGEMAGGLNDRVMPTGSPAPSEMPPPVSADLANSAAMAPDTAMGSASDSEQTMTMDTMSMLMESAPAVAGSTASEEPLAESMMFQAQPTPSPQSTRRPATATLHPTREPTAEATGEAEIVTPEEPGDTADDSQDRAEAGVALLAAGIVLAVAAAVLFLRARR